MSDIKLIFSPFEYFVIALVVASPGVVIGAGLGALAWRRRRIAGVAVGAVLGALLCIAAAYVKLVLWS